jgi:nitroreductase
LREPRHHPVLELIRRRVSAEDFDPDRALDDDEIRAIVADAILAPSSFNLQHWRFLALRTAEDKERLQRAAFGQEQVSRAAVTFVVLGDTRAVDRLPAILEVAVERGAIAEGKAAAWIRMAREIYADERLARDEAIRSASLAAMVLMLAAEARGLVAGALTGFDPDEVRREFHIAPRHVPVMLLAVGHPRGVPAVRMPRLAVDEVLVFDRWRET